LVSNSVRDLSGNTFSFQASLGFTTALAADTTAPVIVASNPPAGAVDVPINVKLQVQFTEALALHSLGQVSLLLGGQPVAVTTTLEDSQRRLLLTPEVPLLGSMFYVMRVTGIQDLSGNVITPVDVPFATGPGADLRSPTVITTDPPANATGVSPSASITIQFSERVNLNSVTSSTVRLLRAGSVQVAATFVLSADGTSVTLVPDEPLQAFTSYTLQISSVLDLAGWGTSFVSRSFTTGGLP
jgi:hypothetical protein